MKITVMGVIRYTLVCGLFVLLGFVWSREIPRLKIFILDQLEILSQTEAGLKVKAKSVEFRVFPVGIQFNRISISPLNKEGPLKGPVDVDAVGIFLDLPALLAGRFEIDKVSVEHPIATLEIKKDSEPSNKKKTFNWNQIIDAPIRSIIIDRAEIKAALEPLQIKASSQSVSLSIEKNYSAAKLEFFVPDLDLSPLSQPEKILHLGVMTRVIAEQSALEVAAFKVALGDNYIIARGVGRGETTRFEFPFVNGRVIYDADLAKTIEAVKVFMPNLSLPAVNGHSRIEVTARAERGKDPEISVHTLGSQITMGKFKFGDLEASGIYDKKGIRSNNISILNSGAKAHVSEVTVALTPEHKFSGKLNVESLELHNFLQTIGIENTPVHLDLKVEVPCEGTLSPLLVKCAGAADGKDFRIFTDENKTVVALDQFRVESEVVVDKTQITFPKALLKVGNSFGDVNGLVNFKDGFQFNYHTDKLDFADVKSLADLKFVGALSITGTTRGDGHHGIIDADGSTNQFWFEDYGLGAAHLHANFTKGFLTLSQVSGSEGNTTYTGDVGLSLSDDTGKPKGLDSAHLMFPKVDLADLQHKIFGKKVTLPFESQGVGSAELTASGPLALSKLTYNLKTLVTKVKVAGENFDEVKFNVHGVDGHAYADDVYMKKGHGILVWTGDVLPSGIMNVNIRGSQLRLSELDHVQSLATTLDGSMELTAKLREFILTPQLDIHGDLTHLSLNDQGLEDSQLNLGINHLGLKLEGSLFSNKITGHLDYPFKEQQPFNIAFTAVDWDFSPLLNFFAKSPRRDYDTNLSARVNLQGKDGDILKSSGFIQVDHIYIRHGNSELRNTQPMIAQFENGRVNVNESEVRGENTELTFSGNKNRHDAINLNVNGRIDLSLLTFLTPFLRDMAGELSLSTQIAGTLDKPDVLGSAFINHGYFRLEALPQPFEGIHTDFLFSQKRVLINKLTGHYGGGHLSANGSITFNEFGDIPVDLNGELLQTALTLPEGFLSHGDFHFSISGSWFPYLMKGDYAITEGLYTKNFGSDPNDNTLKRSTYLPKMVLQKDFVPIEVDIASHFQNGIQIRNSLIDAEVKGDLAIKGDPSHPILQGDVLAKPGGKIFFRETPFTITETRVSFNNPNEINPTVYTLATTRVRDWDVTLLVTGTMQKYQIELTSNPPLSKKSIVSLLALGVTEDDENKTQQALVTPNSLSSVNTSQSQTQTQGYEAGSLLLSDNPLKDELKKRFGINVRISQTVDDLHNVVIPHVVAEKSWTPQISTRVSKSLGDYATQDATIEYKLDRHFSVLGSFEQRDYDLYSLPGISGAQPTNQQQILGLDLQFQVQFK